MSFMMPAGCDCASCELWLYTLSLQLYALRQQHCLQDLLSGLGTACRGWGEPPADGA